VCGGLAMWGMGVLAASRGASESNALGRGSRAGWGALPSTKKGGRGLDPLLVVFCVGGLPPAQPEIYSYALIVDAPVKHTAENGNMQV